MHTFSWSTMLSKNGNEHGKRGDGNGEKENKLGNKVTDSIGPQSSLFYFWFVCFFDVLTPSIAFFFSKLSGDSYWSPQSPWLVRWLVISVAAGNHFWFEEEVFSSKAVRTRRACARELFSENDANIVKKTWCTCIGNIHSRQGATFCSG